MRAAISFLLLATMLAVVGCSKGGVPTGMNPRAQTNPRAQAGQLSFNPNLRLTWPGVPTENSQVAPTETGDVKNYFATFADKQPGGIIIYSAFVTEYPAKMLESTSPQQLLAAYVLAFQKDETSRREIEHGPRKFPGLEVTRRQRNLFDRLLVVMAGPRLSSVSVGSSREELLHSPVVEAFFDSFSVEE